MNISNLNIDLALAELFQQSMDENHELLELLASSEPTYPKDHLPAMRVPKGGSSCSSCEYLADNKTDCTNEYFQKWHGSATIPAPIDEYCSDWYESEKDIQAYGTSEGVRKEWESRIHNAHGISVAIFDRYQRSNPNAISVRSFLDHDPAPQSERLDLAKKFMEAKKVGTEDVDIDKLTPLQNTVFKDKVESISTEGMYKNPITVLRYKDQQYVVDGHHRLAVWALDGHDTIPANIYELSKEVKAYGTSEGVTKAWDTRGRGRHPSVPDTLKNTLVGDQSHPDQYHEHAMKMIEELDKMHENDAAWKDNVEKMQQAMANFPFIHTAKPEIVPDIIKNGIEPSHKYNAGLAFDKISGLDKTVFMRMGQAGGGGQGAVGVMIDPSKLDQDKLVITRLGLMTLKQQEDAMLRTPGDHLSLVSEQLHPYMNGAIPYSDLSEVQSRLLVNGYEVDHTDSVGQHLDPAAILENDHGEMEIKYADAIPPEAVISYFAGDQPLDSLSGQSAYGYLKGKIPEDKLIAYKGEGLHPLSVAYRKYFSGNKIHAGGPGSGCNPEVAKCGRPAGEVEESPADQERDKAFNELEAIRDWQQGSHYIRAAATTIVTGVKSSVLYDTDATKDAAILLDAIRNGTVFTRPLYRGLSVNDPKSPVLTLKTGDELQLPMQSFTKELGVAHQFAIGSTPNDTHVVFATEDGTKGLDIAAAVGQGVFNEVEVVTNGKFKVTNVEDVKSFGPDKFHVIHVQQLGTF